MFQLFKDSGFHGESQSVVAFSKNGEVLVGDPARRQAVSNPDRTIMAAKRKMGTQHVYKIDTKEYTPQQISAFILQKIKRDAEAFLGTTVEKAVITVPAYFDDDQRQATKDAGTIAGLEVVRIVNEPTAASLAYGLDKQEKEMKVLVFDLGGGTLDVTLMEFGDGVFEVKSTSGDTKLGGTDMDEVLIKHLLEEFKKQEGVDLSKDSMAMQRLREAAEKAKIELSTTLDTDINLPFITATSEGPKHFSLKLRRAKLEELIEPIIERCKSPIDQAIKDAGVRVSDIHKIIMVGGPTRMPIVQKFVERYVGKTVERGVDPMECVAMGAAVQAGILAGEIKDVLLLDVTPLSLGIETLGGVLTKLIERNTTIPTKKTQIFSTAGDGQTAVTIKVYQGERPMAVDNKILGQFDLTGIPPAPRGIPQIEVTFDIDANGILNVTAKDKGTGKEQSIRITAPNKLTEAEVEEMRKQAEQHAEDDRERKELAETVNQADNMVYTTEKLMKDFEGKVKHEKIEKIKSEVQELRVLLEQEKKDISKLKKKIEDIDKIVQEASVELYQQASASSQQGSQGQESPDYVNPEDIKSDGESQKSKDKEKVVDAEFEESEESKESEAQEKADAKDDSDAKEKESKSKDKKKRK